MTDLEHLLLFATAFLILIILGFLAARYTDKYLSIKETLANRDMAVRRKREGVH